MNKLFKNSRIIKLFILLLITILLLGCGIALFYFISLRKENLRDKYYFESLSDKKQIGRLVSVDKAEGNIYYKYNYPLIGDDKIDNEIKNIVDDSVNIINKKYSLDGNVEYYYFGKYETYIGMGYLLSIILYDDFVTDDLKLLENSYESYIFDLNTGDMLSNEDIFNDDYIDVLQGFVKNQKLDKNFKYYVKNDQLVLLDYDVTIPLMKIKDILKIDLSRRSDYTNKNSEPVYDVVNKEMQLVESTVLYDEDKIVDKYERKIEKDTVVNVYAQSDTGWSIILLDNKALYVETRYLKVPDIISDVQETPNGKIVYAITDLNIRKDKSVKSEIVGELKRGESVIRIEDDGSWSKVLYNNQEAYVSSSYLSLVEVKIRNVKLNIPPQGNIDPNKPMVALSFDDGPNPISTPMILDVLEKYNVRATFFDLGNLMEKYPLVVKREAELGEVGTHTYSHKNMTKLSVDEINNDLKLSRNAFKKILGYDPILIRAPYGSVNATFRALADMPIIGWDVDSLDWKYLNKDLTLDEIDKYGNLDGRIILMHSIHVSTAEAVEILVPDLLDRGYQIVTVSELAQYKGYILETGTVYNNFK